MSIDEALDVTRIYSVADQLPADMPMIRARPIRAPHHPISHTGLAGADQIGPAHLAEALQYRPKSLITV